MDPVAALESAIGGELLRARLLRRPLPSLAGRYAIESILGRGATGLVVAARDERLRRDVALKLSQATEGERVLDEARSLAKLHHPNVVLLFDAEILDAKVGGRKHRLLVISMQRVRGASLRVWLREAERTPDEIVAIFVGAGAGLAGAHAANVVHRDFKPDNVLVSDAGVPQVLDFGFALLATSTRSAEHGRPSDVAGTDAYMAPEARLGIASTRSDQYAFAMSMAEALTGALGRPQRAVPRGVSRDVWAAIVRATSEDPNARFREMNELLLALRSARPPVRARPLYVVALGASVGVAGLAIAGTQAPWLDPQPTEPSFDLQPDVVPVSVADAAVVDATMVVASDAGASAMVVGDARALSGVYELVTTADDGRTSRYELTLAAGETPPTVSLRRTSHSRTVVTAVDQSLVVLRSELSSSGTLSIEARLDDRERTYDFELRLEEGTGRFDSTDQSLGPQHGVVAISRVSHFEPVVGHDARRPR